MKERKRIHRMKADPSPDVIAESGSLLRATEVDSGSQAAAAHRPPEPTTHAGVGHDLSGFVLVPEQLGAGRPLPADLQEKFGQSFGSHLGRVRIHTDPGSSEVAASMNARALTIGQHVYFGEGEYTPGSASGDELLAHEMVHVAQQAHAKPVTGAIGAAPAALEAEADALAARVGQGAPVRTSTAPAVAAAAKTKERRLAHELQTEAEAAEVYDTETKLDDSKAVWQETLTASTVKDHQAAEAELNRIKAAEPLLLDAIGTSSLKGMENPSEDTLTDNRKAELMLGKFLSESGIQSAAMSNFQQQYARLAMDMDRLDAMTVILNLTGKSGKDFAEGALKSQQLTASDKARMSADTDNPDATASGPLATKKAEVRQWKDRMTTAAAALAPASQATTEKQYRYQAKVDDIAAGLQPRNAPQAVNDLNQLKEKLEKIKGYAKLATGFATKALGGYLGTAAGAVVEQTLAGSGSEALEKKAEKAGEAAKEKVTEAAPDLLNDFVGFLATLPWEGDLAVAEAKAHAALEEQTWHAKEQQLNELKADTIALKKSLTEYVNQAVSLEHAKAMVRRTMEETGRVADRSGGGRHGDKWETLATFLAESEAYLAQSQATIALGRDEMDQAARTGATREEVTASSGEVHWWSVRKQKRVASDSMKWVKEKHLIHLPFGVGSAAGVRGANAVIKADLERLETHRKFIQEFRDRLAAEFSGLKE